MSKTTQLRVQEHTGDYSWVAKSLLLHVGGDWYMYKDESYFNGCQEDAIESFIRVTGKQEPLLYQQGYSFHELTRGK